MLTILLGLLILYAWWAPSSRLGQWLARHGDATCAWLSRQRPLNLILLAAFLAALTGLVLYAETEGLMVAMPVGAEGLAWFAAFDIGTYVEVLAAAWLLNARTSPRAIARMLRMAPRVIGQRLRRLWTARRRFRAARRPSRVRPGDDADPSAWVRFPGLVAA